ncbi:MAG TPA: hypothetical protein VJC16_04010 [Candidatus Nanoarchaeia archaeon]|nr:hypothetical protein [Candidatus Nanoarchaeia archaeon]
MADDVVTETGVYYHPSAPRASHEYLFVFIPRDRTVNFNPSGEEYQGSPTSFFPMPLVSEALFNMNRPSFRGTCRTNILVQDLIPGLQMGEVQSARRDYPLSPIEVAIIRSELAARKTDVVIYEMTNVAERMAYDRRN